ncbi:Protein of unknown function [Cotesia congregata]|uniref:Uncharacterized protein n=1 Tax=Cotesia congregata TaxID=51543 RepID=A0A8J2MTW6_COTCN|nr:Protein of unknown function [Cotesia congregata]
MEARSCRDKPQLIIIYFRSGFPRNTHQCTQVSPPFITPHSINGRLPRAVSSIINNLPDIYRFFQSKIPSNNVIKENNITDKTECPNFILVLIFIPHKIGGSDNFFNCFPKESCILNPKAKIKSSIRIGIDVAFDVSLMTINQIAGAFRILNKGSLSTMDSLDAIENANSDDNETHEETTRNVGQEETSSELQHHLQTDTEYSAR